MDRVHIRIGLIQTDISVGNVSSSSASLCGPDDKIICMFGAYLWYAWDWGSAWGSGFEYLQVESSPPLIQGNTLSESITDSQFGNNKFHTVYHDHIHKKCLQRPNSYRRSVETRMT